MDNEQKPPPKPLWVHILMAILRTWLYVYDLVMYIPIMIFVNPRERVARSERTKAIRIPKTNVWRNVDEPNRDHLTRDVYRAAVHRVETIFSRASMMYGGRKCMGSRKILGVEYELQKNGKKFEKLTLGDYEWMTYSQVDDRVRAIAAGLDSIGHKTKQPLCIFAETRSEWMMTALACFRLNIPVATVYATLGEEAISHAINETDSTTLITTQELLPVIVKMLADHTTTLKRVIYFESGNPDAKQAPKVDDKKIELFTLTQMCERGDNHDVVHPNGVADDIALIMYTSGTTGTPKGVMITHENLISTSSAVVLSIPELGDRDDDTFCAYLPLAHILEVDCELACLFNGVAIGYSSALTMTDRSSKIPRNTKGDCSLLRPTLLPSVPAIMDRIYKNVTEEMSKAGPFLSSLIEVCFERRRSRMISGYDDPFLNRFVFARVRGILGGRVRAMLCGGAPLNSDTQRFISINFCCPVLQGYGLTETCGCGTICDFEDLDVGHVGAVMMCSRFMLREWTEGGYSPADDPPSGEILVSGPNVSPGYWRQEAKTKEDFIVIDGVSWFCTGDIGAVRRDGCIKIVDRKKDLVKLSHGEYVSLAKVETALSTHPLVDNVCIYADSTQASTVALVVPNEAQLMKLAASNNIAGDKFVDLCSNQQLASLVCKTINEHGLKNNLNRIELPSRVHLCPEVWTSAMGLLTEALKLKRRQIADHYKDALAVMYGAQD